MTGFIGRRERTDGGFTLVELLIVMIILAILMSIAIPTFLNHKSKALLTNTKANISLAQKTMESCSAGNTMGVFAAGQDGVGPGSAPFDCAKNVALDETSLKAALDATIASPGGMTITTEPVPAYGYTIEATTASAPNKMVLLRLVRTNDTLKKECLPASGVDPAEAAKVCPTGTW